MLVKRPGALVGGLYIDIAMYFGQTPPIGNLKGLSVTIVE